MYISLLHSWAYKKPHSSTVGRLYHFKPLKRSKTVINYSFQAWQKKYPWIWFFLISCIIHCMYLVWTNILIFVVFLTLEDLRKTRGYAIKSWKKETKVWKLVWTNHMQWLKQIHLTNWDNHMIPSLQGSNGNKNFNDGFVFPLFMI